MKIMVTAEISDLFFFVCFVLFFFFHSRRALVIQKVWYVCQIIGIAKQIMSTLHDSIRLLHLRERC